MEETPLSIVLNDILSDYYLKGTNDTIFLNKLKSIILVQLQTNPFDKLEANQKNDFENLRVKLNDNFYLVQNDINRISEELYKNGFKLKFENILLPCYGEKNRIQSVFQNLMQNALKFSRDIEGAYIEVGSRKLNENFVEYWVKDNGIGIEPEEQGKIFSIFYKVRDTGREGHGIGLAIAKKIVEHHGGRLRIESKKGAGTTFSFTLPEIK